MSQRLEQERTRIKSEMARLDHEAAGVKKALDAIKIERERTAAQPEIYPSAYHNAYFGVEMAINALQSHMLTESIALLRALTDLEDVA